jgi:TetR/AcrR family transcriptional repressor of mexJK operon
MTLYRHARTKEDLFEAVVSEACAPSPGTDDAAMVERILKQPLVEILAFIALRFRDRLTNPETLGLLRAVMIEHSNFPHLGRMTFDSLIASHVRQMVKFIRSRPEAAGISESRCAELSAAFFDRLLGADQLKALLGLPLADGKHRRALARRAGEDFVAALVDARRAGR